MKFRLRTFGGLALEREDGQPVNGGAAQKRRLALLACLAAGERSVSREKLLLYFWPDEAPDDARHNLSQQLYALKRALGADPFVITGGDLRIDPEVLTSDVAEFEHALVRREPECAVELYRGPFLDGFFLSEAPEFERWAEDERARRQAQLLGALETLATAADARAEHDRAAQWCQRRVNNDQLNPQAVVALMIALEKAGNAPAALKAAQLHAELVSTQVGMPPDPVVVQTEGEIKRRAAERHRRQPVGFPPTDPPSPDPSPPPAPPPPYDPNARLLAGRYRVGRQIGHGGSADVFLGHDVKHRRDVAIKFLRREVASAVVAESFLREIAIAAKLHHAHIIPLFDSGEDGSDGTLFYVMPVADGESVRDRLKRERRLPPAEALRIALEVADALGYAHDDARGVVHRDIKPENILLTAGHAMVSDFGIARAIGEAAGDLGTLTRTGAIGTPPYASPEQLYGIGPLDGRSDIYSLGCVLYEMLAGEPPRAPDENGHPSGLGRFRAWRRGIPPRIAKVIAKATQPLPENRYRTVGDMAAALVGAERGRAPALLPAAGLAVAAAVVALAYATAGQWTGRTDDPTWTRREGGALDPHRIAIAPFNVDSADAELSRWPETMVHALYDRLDGIGPLRFVPPSIVAAYWDQRPTLADGASAVRLARAKGASLAIFGTVSRMPGDSVRLFARVFDAGRAEQIGSATAVGSLLRADPLIDSLAFHLLDELARARTLRAVAHAPIRARSFAVLRAFADGEQYYRHNALDSALAAFRRAIEYDSSYALAYRGKWRVLRRYWESDPEAVRAALDAGALNHGLPERDSVLVVTDSVYAALDGLPVGTPQWWSLMRRLFALHEQAIERFDHDPEVWMQLGETRIHYGEMVGFQRRRALDVFEHVIELDSAFAPAYFHVVELGLPLRGPGTTARRIATYATLNPSDTGMRLVGEAIAGRGQPRQGAAAGAASPDARSRAAYILREWPDSAESAVRLVEGFTPDERGRVTWIRAPLPHLLQFGTLLQRGHLRRAYAVADSTLLQRTPEHLATLALFGVIPADSMAAAAAGWLRAGDARAITAALSWWAMRGDSASLLGAARQLGQRARPAADPPTYGDIAARAYLELARRDSARALRLFQELPDSACWWWCWPMRLTTARLLAGHGQYVAAAAALDRRPPAGDIVRFPDVLWFLERAEVAERLHDVETAREHYALVADTWAHADPELASLVERARSGLGRVSAGTSYQPPWRARR